jgi:methylmalonyl-CoA/ethylmalonyl-CoA epimerase
MKKIDFFGEGTEFSHVGVAVKSIDTCEGVSKVLAPLQKVFIAFVEVNGVTLELIEPLDDSSPVSGVLKKGGGAYHLCYKVLDLKFSCEKAQKNGFVLFGAPVEAVVFVNKKIAWLFHPVYGIFELLEK